MAIDRTETVIYCPACDTPLTIPLTLKHAGQGEATVSGDLSALRAHIDESHPGPSSTPSDDTAHRDALRILLSRVTRGVLLPDESELLRQHVETELAASDKARRDLATMTHVARANGRGHSIAYQASVEARAELDKAQATIARVRSLTGRWAKRTDQLKRAAELLEAALDGTQHTCPDSEPCPPHDEPAPGAEAAIARARKLIEMQKQLLGTERRIVMTALDHREDQGARIEHCDHCGRDHMAELDEVIQAADIAYAKAFPATADGPATGA